MLRIAVALTRGRRSSVDRQAWLDERRTAVVASYDAEARTYDDDPYPNETQLEWVARLLDTCPADGVVLDAPCGTGQYFPIVAAAGHRVVGDFRHRAHDVGVSAMRRQCRRENQKYDRD